MEAECTVLWPCWSFRGLADRVQEAGDAGFALLMLLMKSTCLLIKSNFKQRLRPVQAEFRACILKGECQDGKVLKGEEVVCTSSCKEGMV